MKLYCENSFYKLYDGKMEDVLSTFPDNVIDSIVCDPPYDLTTMTQRLGKSSSKSVKGNNQYSRLTKGFMGKEWDGTGVAFKSETWMHCLRVLKPGGYLIAFGGTRTFHRMMCAIEDAGFIIVDTLMWLYGSGFPKSHDASLLIDKKLGHENRGHRIATANRCHPDGTKEPNGEYLPKYQCKTEDAKKWQGYGTRLKPAFEPIILAQKPLDGTIADNLLKHHVGVLNIDECRVGGPSGRFPANVITDGSEEISLYFPSSNKPNGSISKNYKTNNQVYNDFGFVPEFTSYNDVGNVIRFYYCAKASNKDRDEGLENYFDKKLFVQSTGGQKVLASGNTEYINDGISLNKIKQRFNTHPTVKPCELMQYLIRLVTPKGGTILDPFNGSGSTGKAAMIENRERNANYYYIGIDLTSEYLPISAARMDYAINKYDYDMEQLQSKTGQLNIFEFKYE